MYEIILALQKDMKERGISPELFTNDHKISIPIANLVKDENYTHVINSIESLMDVKLRFKDEKGKGGTHLINKWYHPTGSKKVDLWIPVDILDYVLNLASGYTLYNFYIAKTLKSKYSKRMYEFCCENKKDGGFYITVTELRERLLLQNTLKDINAVKVKVLDIARNELAQKADIWFNYAPVKEGRAIKAFRFSLHYNPAMIADDKGAFSQVYAFLTIVYPSAQSSKAKDLADALKETGRIGIAWNKFRRIYNDVQDGKKTIAHAKHTIIKILREDFPEVNI
jgi:plasmid replication initiation protein